MKKEIGALGILGALLISRVVYAADNWTGDGGRGKSLVIEAPEADGLAENQAYIPGVVQREFVSNFVNYSAIEVSADEIQEATYAVVLSDPYDDEDPARLDYGHLPVPDYTMTGNITKTATGYALQMQIVNNTNKATAASYSGRCTFEELDNYTGIHKASLDMLQKMGVRLTAKAIRELQQAASQQTIQGQTALAQGIIAERGGSTIEALALYNQAASFDPSLMEAANRASIVSVNIRTGNIGQDLRNKQQWYDDWKARLIETEQYFDTFFKTFNQPYALIYTTEPQYGDQNFTNRTIPVSFIVELRERLNWTDPIKKTVNEVWQGLDATGQKAAWGFENWPQRRVSNVSPFTNRSKSLRIVVELLNEQKKVIGQQTFEERGSWSFSFNRDGSIQSITSSGEGEKTIRFPAIKVDDITEGLTLQFTTVNGVPIPDASKDGVLMVTTRSAYRDFAGFNYYGGGYDWDGYDKEGYDEDGFNREGYNRLGYNRDGYNRLGYDRDGYNRLGYDRNDFNKEGYHVNGTLYDKAGYDRAGYDKADYGRDGYDNAGYDRDGYNRQGYGRDGYDNAGYDRDGYNRAGITRGSLVLGPDYMEILYTFRPGFPLGATIGISGIYISASSGAVSDKPTGTEVKNEGETITKDGIFSEWVLGYAFNLLSTRKGFKLDLPLGIGYNDLEEQVVVEAGLQLRFLFFGIRGTYRTSNSFTISIGLCGLLGFMKDYQ